MRMPAGGHSFDGAWIKDGGEGSREDRIALYAGFAEGICIPFYRRLCEVIHRESDIKALLWSASPQEVGRHVGNLVRTCGKPIVLSGS